jgi:CheY-like chemotaxis protein
VPPEQSTQTAASGHSSRFILLGEDDVDDEELLKEVFLTIDESLALVFVNNGRKVISSLQAMDDSNLPCLIILDYNMPEMTGAEILRELKNYSRYAQIPKIIWSTSGSDTYKSICLKLGAGDYITKPSNVKNLAETARYMLSFC